ncbi:unnamed protein product [Prunus armeniaca]|uniref:Uncharacterized protein n=1 Tax=Prunus armeniaca TaxID=36596 RepID=A0A6J5YB24_PRUAR|nr:unnamed protein product [Prunus armeniaca]
MKSDEGTPPPQLSDVESQLSDVELSGSNGREEMKMRSTRAHHHLLCMMSLSHHHLPWNSD